MPILTLRVTSGRLVGTSRSFTESGIVIGRSERCTWSLPDADLVLSREHCRISQVGGDYVLTDTSKNGVYHNDLPHPMGAGQSEILADGDVFTMGDYRFEVRIVANPAPEPAVPAVSSSLDQGWGAFAADPNPVPAPPWPEPATPADHLPVLHQAIPDPVAISPRPSPPSRPGAPGGFDIDSFLSGPLVLDPPGAAAGLQAPPSAPSYPTPSSPAPSSPAPSSPAWSRAPGGGLDPLLSGPLDLEAPPAPAGVRWPPPTPLNPTPQHPARPNPAPPSAVMPQRFDGAEPSPPAGRGPSDPTDLLAVFLKAAGCASDIGAAPDPQATMQAAGRIYRETIKGLCGLLAIRNRIKGELRIDRTVMQARGNNPLKFAPDPDEAARQLLEAPLPGYLAADEAVREAFEDLSHHEVATVMAMKTALSVLLRRFDPAALKTRLDRQSLLAGLVPGSRSAKYWELYETFYQQITGEAEEDFQAMLAREFADAYEHQIRAITATGDPPPAGQAALTRESR